MFSNCGVQDGVEPAILSSTFETRQVLPLSYIAAELRDGGCYTADDSAWCWANGRSRDLKLVS